MIIKQIEIQNFKSFGNKLQKLSFDKEGQLILMMGRNASGKSSFQESFDFALFGIVRGKERKKIPIKSLPNRDNGGLYTGIKFINDNNDDIEIKRYVDPSKFFIYKNEENYTKQFKSLSDNEKEDLIGFNYDVYKSFISLNINDFLNFISLDTETKKKLLNRLFNIEELDGYYSIVKDILKTLEKNKEKYLKEILDNNKTIETYNITLDMNNSKYQTKDDIKTEILSLKSDFDQKKESIRSLGDNIKECSSIIKDKQELFTNRNNQIIKYEVELKTINKKIDVFEKGKCPICKSDLKNDIHYKEYDNLKEEKEHTEKIVKNLKDENIDLKKEISNQIHKKNELSKERNDLMISFGTLENKIKDLKYEYTNFKSDYKTEILENINKLEKSNTHHQKTLDELNIKIEKYTKLMEIFSEGGVRKDIIKNVVKPINSYLQSYLEKLESRFTVKMNDEFDAIIYERMINEIPSETLSVGEARKINLGIALSYMELIFTLRKTNLLFIDEVFASIDEINVGILLQIFKDFAKKHKINIVIVNHSFMDENVFDRILRIEKNYYSDIIDN